MLAHQEIADLLGAAERLRELVQEDQPTKRDGNHKESLDDPKTALGMTPEGVTFQLRPCFIPIQCDKYDPSVCAAYIPPHLRNQDEHRANACSPCDDHVLARFGGKHNAYTRAVGTWWIPNLMSRREARDKESLQLPEWNTSTTLWSRKLLGKQTLEQAIGPLSELTEEDLSDLLLELENMRERYDRRTARTKLLTKDGGLIGSVKKPIVWDARWDTFYRIPGADLRRLVGHDHWYKFTPSRGEHTPDRRLFSEAISKIVDDLKANTQKVTYEGEDQLNILLLRSIAELLIIGEAMNDCLGHVLMASPDRFRDTETWCDLKHEQTRLERLVRETIWHSILHPDHTTKISDLHLSATIRTETEGRNQHSNGGKTGLRTDFTLGDDFLTFNSVNPLFLDYRDRIRKKFHETATGAKLDTE